MTAQPGPNGAATDTAAEFRSVDWEELSEKRDWSGVAWTTAAVLVILLGFFGGMVFRTNLTEGPEPTAELVPPGYEVLPDTQHVRNAQVDP